MLCVTILVSHSHTDSWYFVLLHSSWHTLFSVSSPSPLPPFADSRRRRRREINLWNLWSHSDEGSWATVVAESGWLAACIDLSSYSEIGVRSLLVSHDVYSADATASVQCVLWFQMLLQLIISSWQWIKTNTSQHDYTSTTSELIWPTIYSKSNVKTNKVIKTRLYTMQ